MNFQVAWRVGMGVGMCSHPPSQESKPVLDALYRFALDMVAANHVNYQRVAIAIADTSLGQNVEPLQGLSYAGGSRQVGRGFDGFCRVHAKGFECRRGNDGMGAWGYSSTGLLFRFFPFGEIALHFWVAETNFLNGTSDGICINVG
jgi:hypothetical protein